MKRTAFDECTKSKTYAVYAQWCKDNLRKDKVSKAAFREELEKANIGDIKLMNGIRYYADFTLSPEMMDDYGYIIKKASSWS